MKKRTREEYDDENRSDDDDEEEHDEEETDSDSDEDDKEQVSEQVQKEILETERQIIKMASENYTVKDVSSEEEDEFVKKLKDICDGPKYFHDTIIFDKDHHIIEEIMRQNRVMAQDAREKKEFIKYFENSLKSSRKYTKKYPTVSK